MLWGTDKNISWKKECKFLLCGISKQSENKQLVTRGKSSSFISSPCPPHSPERVRVWLLLHAVRRSIWSIRRGVCYLGAWLFSFLFPCDLCILEVIERASADWIMPFFKGCRGRSDIFWRCMQSIPKIQHHCRNQRQSRPCFGNW